ncbi:hypothetical protein CYMTET_50962 [Cymbomonas tetramitiformis]|uniref:non-specific serine/threonine protein kinase n=1 Tax=Cymbomonas tetramitiformis TaxID=36881 RepID=A0AAE0BM78_9CHLO|nr:hypothetical protein CYMTET_50962 [Cymbomonas tetramitiformis]
MDNYTKISVIGSGSFGKVYKVKGNNDGKYYVMKRISLHSCKETDKDAALQEVMLLAGLRHPHICPYIDHFWDDLESDLCIVMAYCEYGDLHNLIEKRRKSNKYIPEAQVWKWMIQLFLSLQYLHSKKILHRDVKSQNIFLTKQKIVMLGDFGLSKQLQHTFDMAKTPIGTPFYMAPEVMEGKPYSFKGDVWALGCVLYELCTLKAAFAASNFPRVALKVLRGTFAAIDDTKYSADLRNIINMMLTSKVTERPTIEELLTRPEVSKRAEEYISEVEASDQGWDTWKSRLPYLLSLSAALSPICEKSGSHYFDAALEKMDEGTGAGSGDYATAPNSLAQPVQTGVSQDPTEPGADEPNTPVHQDKIDADCDVLQDTVPDQLGQQLKSARDRLGPAASIDTDCEVRQDTVQLKNTHVSGARGVSTLPEPVSPRHVSAASHSLPEPSAERNSFEVQFFRSQLQALGTDVEGVDRFHEPEAPLNRASSLGTSSSSCASGDGGIGAQMTVHRSKSMPVTDSDQASGQTVMAQRTDRLRERCLENLGEERFNRLYEFLQERSALYTDLIEDDFAMKIELEQILGDDELEYWPLMDELIFLESKAPVHSG